MERPNLNETIKGLYSLRNLPDPQRKAGVRAILNNLWELPLKEMSFVLSMASAVLSGDQSLSQDNHQASMLIMHGTAD
jgi:hypothetical protein